MTSGLTERANYWPKCIIAAAALVLCCYSPARAQRNDLTPPKVEVKATFGASGFGDELSYPHVVAGGAVRFYITRRLSVGPELLYMRRSRDDEDYLFMPSVAYDLTDPTHKAVPYIIGGVGAFQHRGRFGTSSPAWAVDAGGGVKIFLNDRLFVAPEARLGVVGQEATIRGVVSIGYVISGRRRESR
jgi:hypothetical protein